MKPRRPGGGLFHDFCIRVCHFKIPDPTLYQGASAPKIWPFCKADLRKSRQKCLKMYDLAQLRKCLHFKFAKIAYFTGETLIFSWKGPLCKTLFWSKGDPFVRQNFKNGPFCKAKFSQTHPVKWHTHSILCIGRTPPGQEGDKGLYKKA